MNYKALLSILKIRESCSHGEKNIILLVDENDIEAVTESIAATISKVQPKKATVEFGVEVRVKSGKLTALIVEGEGKGNLKITLEWGG